ncbi:MAG: Fe-S cluster assembly protein SufB, partial [Thermoanaerobaculia bacterium]
MSDAVLDRLTRQEYPHGFVTDIDTDAIPAGLSEDVVRLISGKKGEPEWLLDWRLKAYRHWLTMTEPKWARVTYPPIDYQKIVYYAAPKSAKDGAPKSLAEVDPELIAMYEKLGVPLKEREILA